MEKIKNQEVVKVLPILLTEEEKNKNSRNGQEKGWIEEHGKDVDVKNGEYAVTKFRGQTFFYVPKEKFKKLNFQRIIELIEEVYDKEFNYLHHEYNNSYHFELPSAFFGQGHKDDGKVELLIGKLEEELKKI